jgi:deoxycytidylate deaminase
MRQFAMDAATEVRLESNMKQRVGAALVRGNRIIGLASNKTGCSPAGGWSRHAEIRACINRNAFGASVYVSRVHGHSGTPLLAKPCRVCQAWLTTIGVRRVYFSVAEPPYWEEMRL